MSVVGAVGKDSWERWSRNRGDSAVGRKCCRRDQGDTGGLVEGLGQGWVEELQPGERVAPLDQSSLQRDGQCMRPRRRKMRWWWVHQTRAYQGLGCRQLVCKLIPKTGKGRSIKGAHCGPLGLRATSTL